MALTDDLTRWQLWWEMNRDRYLLIKESIRVRSAVTGGDQYYLGSTRRPTEASQAPDPAVTADRILPALNQALEDSNNPHIVTACLIGMAKIGRDTPALRLRDVLVRYLSGKYQEVRETAALALGISRQPAALPILGELLLDSKAGRKLAKRPRVDRRVRAFAAYGIGILAANGDLDLRRQSFDLLSQVLHDDQVWDRDIKVAVISAIGVLGLRSNKSGKEKRLLWEALPALRKFYDAKLGKAAQIVQAHVPVAIARLLGRGDSIDHQRFRRHYLDELVAQRRRQNSTYQSAALALGRLTPPGVTEVSDRLYRYFEVGRNHQARYFSLIAMGEIGGPTNRTRLLRVLSRGRKNLERPWAALGLGVLAYKLRTARDGAVDQTIGGALLHQLTTIKNREAVGAFAIALGLCGHLDAADRMRKILVDHPHHDGMVGSLCTGLALMDDKNAVGHIRNVLHRSVRRPDLLRQAAIALGKLRDRGAERDILEMLSEDNVNTARMAALAGALQFIGDRRTVDVLIRHLADTELTNLSRAFIAAALGGIGDPMMLPFNERYAGHSNYRAVVETLSNQATGILDLL